MVQVISPTLVPSQISGGENMENSLDILRENLI